MKKRFIYQVAVIISGLLLTGTIYATEMNHSAHDMAGDSKMEKPFHQSMVEGYTLKYKLIDMREKMKDMKRVEHLKATHHLMVYINKKHEAHIMPVASAKVGYLIEGPDGKKARAMTMAMGGGFGADINLNQKGKYSIKTKIVDGDKRLVDEFNHMVK